ncbi:MAG: sulfate ABC transporter permease subunit [Phototrophicaceae bacterium]
MPEKSVNSLGGFLLVMVVVGYACLLLIGPIIALINEAFNESIGQIIHSIIQADALQALSLTILISFFTVIIDGVLGLLVAWVLVRHKFWGRDFFNSLVDIPFVISPVIVGYVMIVLFGRLGWFKFIPIAFTPYAMLLVTVFVTLPFVIREVMPVLASLSNEQEEAAYTLGASRWYSFRRVIFPALRPALIYGLVLSLARSLGEFGAAAVAGGAIQGATENATIYIFRSLHDRNDIGAYSMALLLGIISIVVLLLMNILKAKESKGN